MEKLVKLLLSNLAYAFEGAAEGKSVCFVEDTETETPADSPEVTEAPKEEEAKEAKTSKSKPNPKRKAYTKDEPANTAAERALYKIQWAEMGKTPGMQDDFLAGKIDSQGKALESADEDEDFGDFGEVETAAPEHTAEEVKAALKKYAADNGKEEAYKVMAQFGAKKIADIKEADFAGVMAEVS